MIIIIFHLYSSESPRLILQVKVVVNLKVMVTIPPTPRRAKPSWALRLKLDCRLKPWRLLITTSCRSTKNYMYTDILYFTCVSHRNLTI